MCESLGLGQVAGRWPGGYRWVLEPGCRPPLWACRVWWEPYLGLHLNSSPVLLGGKSSSYFLNREAYTAVQSKLVNTHLALRKELGSQEALNKRSCYRHHGRGSCSQDVANASRFSILSTQKSFCTEKEMPFLKEIIHSQENLSYSKLLKGLREHRAST